MNLVFQFHGWDDGVEDLSLIHHSINSVKAYAERIGADYIHRTGPRLFPDHMWFYEKFSFMENEYSQYDKIAAFDTDVIIRNSFSESVFDQYETLAVTPYHEIFKQKRLRKNKSAYNTGVVGYSREFIKAYKDHIYKEIRNNPICRRRGYNDESVLTAITGTNIADWVTQLDHNVWNNEIVTMKHTQGTDKFVVPDECQIMHMSANADSVLSDEFKQDFINS